MGSKGYTERDWKLFKEKIAGWQEAYMQRLLDEYHALIVSDETPSTKFWELEKRLKHDKHLAGVMVTMARSKLLFNIRQLILEGAITMDDLDEFSDELKERIGLALRNA